MKKIGYGKNYNYIHEKGEKNEFHFPKEIGKKDYYKEA
jgi:replication-associated recombination protein RarA